MVLCASAVKSRRVNVDQPASVRALFVMEMAMGHVTHYLNLRREAAAHAAIVANWLPVPFGVGRVGARVPLLGTNWAFRAAWRARRALRGQRADAIFFHTQLTALFSLDVIRRVPSIVSLDATPINFDTVGAAYDHRAAGTGWLDQHKFRLNRAVFNAAAALVTWSEWARQSLLDDYGVDPRRISVVAPGAAATYFEIGRQRRAGRTGDASCGAPVRVLFVGNDFPRKGGPDLLGALGPALDTGRCELDVVTGYPVKPRRNVRLHADLGPNADALLDLYRQADLFALPSRGECLSVALMEAMAAGLPVVTTRVGALSEAVADDRSGYTIDPGDSQALRAALEALIASPAKRAAMGDTGFELATHNFDARRNNARLFDLVHTVGSRRITELAAPGGRADARRP
jgi:glycosyltransferase involved in cell wall biosynthesis